MNESFHVSINISNPYPFDKEGLAALGQNHWVQNQWPIVYFIENEGKKIGYIGESANALARIKSHLVNPKKAGILKQVSIISSDKFNKSATLDIESSLIQYVSAEGSYRLQNGNYGLTNHNYYEQHLYKELFKQIWQQLINRKVVHRSLADIENSQVFKYSPYKSLNKEQYLSVLSILDGLTTQQSSRIFIEGSAGTGKTILATYLIKLLKSDVAWNDDTDLNAEALREVRYIIQFQQQYPQAQIGVVVAMKSLRKTLQKVFDKIPGLKASMVMSPSGTFKLGRKYDLLIVDEAHRLRQYRNISWAGIFRKNNQRLGLGDVGTELDWIMANSKNQVFFYDRNQSVRPSDIKESQLLAFLNSNSTLKLTLHSQMRVQGGNDYISFVSDLLQVKRPVGAPKYSVQEYELIMFDSLQDLYRELAIREKKYGLCRLIAGYSWPWLSKENKEEIDIEIDGLQFQWNQTDEDWINSSTAFGEIGCIHTTMGQDLNYGGVIFGREIQYNTATQQIEIDPMLYYDINGKKSITRPEDLKTYIINIYCNMMYRGIRGTFVYACNVSLRHYLQKHIPSYTRAVPLKLLSPDKAKASNFAVPLINIYAAAGNFSQQQLHEAAQWIELPFDIAGREKYFVCKVVGESMNKVIPNGAYCLFRADEGGSRNGKIVLVESTYIQDAEFGSGYTIKEYHSQKNVDAEGWSHHSITLKPLSTILDYKAIELTGDELNNFKVVGIFERVLDMEF